MLSNGILDRIWSGWGVVRFQGNTQATMGFILKQTLEVLMIWGTPFRRAIFNWKYCNIENHGKGIFHLTWPLKNSYSLPKIIYYHQTKVNIDMNYPPVHSHGPWQIGVGRLLSPKNEIFKVYIIVNLLESMPNESCYESTWPTLRQSNVAMGNPFKTGISIGKSL